MLNQNHMSACVCNVDNPIDKLKFTKVTRYTGHGEYSGDLYPLETILPRKIKSKSKEAAAAAA